MNRNQIQFQKREIQIFQIDPKNTFSTFNSDTLD